MTKPLRITGQTGDYGTWRQFSEWGGAEAPRLLFNSLTGDPSLPEGLLGGILTYRGINLPRLFEGTWITLTWPEWFSELAALEDMALAHPDESVFLENPSFVRRYAAQCVQIRHPETTFTTQANWSLSEAAQHIPPTAYRFLRLGRNLLRAARNLTAERVESGGSRCAFFPWSAKIAPHILPVAEAWSHRYNQPVFLAGWNQEAPIDMQEGWVWSNLSREISPHLILEAWRADVQLRRKWRWALNAGRLDALENWHGWDLRPIVIPFLQRTIDHLLPVLLSILVAEAWCLHFRIQAVVLPSDGGEAIRALIAGARLAGVPSFGIQYGFATNNPEIGEPFEDLLFLWGSTTREWYIRRGASPQKVVVVGTTAYDSVIRMQKHREHLRQELAQRFGLDPSQRWVIMATWHVQAVYTQATKEAELDLVVKTIYYMKAGCLLFKLHPSDQGRGELEELYAERYGVEAPIITDVGLNEQLMLAADVLICNYTTLASMAIAVQTPVIIVDLSGQQPCHRAYVDDGVAEFADTTSSLEVALRETLTDKTTYWKNRFDAWQNYIAKHLQNLDGLAGERIYDLISAWLSSNNSA